MCSRQRKVVAAVAAAPAELPVGTIAVAVASVAGAVLPRFFAQTMQLPRIDDDAPPV